jgi:adenosylmethionine-8-amino-7-oxononanoate aminotransferase
MDQADYEPLQDAARDHLWMHFTRHSTYDTQDVPIIVRGEGPYIYDAQGKRYLDALAGLFVSQLGHGRTDLADAAAAQARELAFMPLWSYAHPTAIELAARVASYAPGDLTGSSSPVGEVKR